MNIKESVYIATCLDGFIARNYGALDWLNEANATVPDGEDCCFNAFVDSGWALPALIAPFVELPVLISMENAHCVLNTSIFLRAGKTKYLKLVKYRIYPNQA